MKARNKFRLFRFRRIDYIIIILLEIITISFRAILLPDMPFRFHLYAFLVNTLVIFSVWEFVRFVNIFLDKKLPYEKGLLRRIVIQTLLCLFLIFPIITIIIFFIIPTFVKSAPDIFSNVYKVAAYFVITLVILVINVAFFGKYYLDAWKKAIVDKEQLEKERAQVQYDNLKNQLNPHFLFNTLTSLNSLISENQELASRFLQHLSKVYRYVLQHQDKELVSLSTEVNFIKNYVFLIETRFAHSLKVNIHINPKDAEKQIVPVTLQILIENAIKHNSVSEESPLIISIFTENGFLCVENNLQRKSTVEHSHKMGMANMAHLYSFISQEPMKVFENEFTFKVQVPLIER